MKYITTIDEKEYAVELQDDGSISVNGQTYEVDFAEIAGQRIFTLIINGKSYEAHVSDGEENIWNILLQGTLYEADVVDEREKRLSEAAGHFTKGSTIFMLRSPMPGLVTDIPTTPGDQVNTGDVLLILESMKMQNELRSPQEGIVSEIRVSEGENVEQNQILAVVEPLSSEED